LLPSPSLLTFTFRTAIVEVGQVDLTTSRSIVIF